LREKEINELKIFKKNKKKIKKTKIKKRKHIYEDFVEVLFKNVLLSLFYFKV